MAAVLFVVLGVAIYSWIRIEAGSKNVVQMTEVLSPGSSRATLILAGGKRGASECFHPFGDQGADGYDQGERG